MKTPIDTVRKVINNCSTFIELENVRSWICVYADQMGKDEQKMLYDLVRVKENEMKLNSNDIKAPIQ